MRNRYQTATGRSLKSFRRSGLSQPCIGGLRLILGAFVLAMASGAQAYVTVGPHGSYATIQDGVNQAIAVGGDQVRVELKCFAGCPYAENVNIYTGASVQLSGGWASDFQSQISTLGSPVTGTGGDAPIMRVIAHGSAIVSVSRFVLDGSGNAAGNLTRGLLVGAQNNASVVIADNTISGNTINTITALPPAGGAGMAVQATDSAVISIAGNTIQSNNLFGADGQSAYGGGAFVTTIGGGHVDFVLNTITGNFSNNTAGGGCRGGGLWAASLNTSSMQLRGNTYSGNGQFACNNGATGDAAEIDATNTAIVQVYDETWTSNAVPNDPGVYEVFMQADVSSQILAQNGLITHGTWGGLFANSIASGTITISNYTIADNPVLGFNGYGVGTQVWNTVLWNDGSPYGLNTGASLLWSLYSVDPLFVDSANGNYRLAVGSPAIDAGNNSPTGGLRAFGLDGLSRPFNATADIGAYEYHPDPNDVIFINGFD